MRGQENQSEGNRLGRKTEGSTRACFGWDVWNTCVVGYLSLNGKKEVWARDINLKLSA